MSKSKAYSAIPVQSAPVEAWLVGHDGQAAYVGVDVSKADLKLVLRWADRSFERPVRAENPGQIAPLVGLLGRAAQGRQLQVALEPTGTYGDIFRQAATDAGLAVQRVGSKAAHDYAEVFDGVPSQHDGKDAAVIAELAAQGKSVPWPSVTPAPPEQELALEADLADHYQRQAVAWGNRIESWQARHWPEVGALLELGSVTLLEALREYGSPAALAADAGAAGRLRHWGRWLLKDEKIAALLQAARATVGIRCTETDRQRVRIYAQEALAAKRQVAKCRRVLAQLSVGCQDIERLAGVIGLVTACVLHVRVGDPARYHCGAAYVKALGLNLTERSSGQYRGQKRISKRGSAEARRWLYYAALRLVQKAGVSAWYGRKVARDGGRCRPGLVAVMRRLALAIYHVAKDGAVFDSRRLFAGPRRGPQESKEERVMD